jgi:ubiquinone/menaquinone biosynthesis C-methylase UbiE
MSLGAHRLWKDELISMMGMPAAARCQVDKMPRLLDVAGGTGDVAFRVVEALYKSYGG